MTDIISSPQNPRIKEVVSLRESRARRERRLVLVDGAREIERALAAGLQFDAAYWCEGDDRGDFEQTVAARLGEAGVSVVRVSPRVFEKIGYGERDEGMVAIAHRPTHTFAALARREAGLIVVIDGLEKPGNVGAILRSAEGAGATGVIVTNPASDPYGPNAIRASTGAVFLLPLVEATADDSRDWLLANGYQLVATRPDARRIYTDFDYTRPTAVILGSEAQGLGDAWGESTVGARIPMSGRVDSLNVSVSAAIVLYEAVRQRIQSK